MESLKAQTIAPSNTPLMLDAKALFKGSKEIQIVHNDMVYRLQLTRNDKLILIKSFLLCFCKCNTSSIK